MLLAESFYGNMPSWSVLDPHKKGMREASRHQATARQPPQLQKVFETIVFYQTRGLNLTGSQILHN